MLFYLAPMEGITTSHYRKIHHRYFSGINKYYTPFIVANQNFRLKTREKKELLNNEGMIVVPQILSNKANEFLWAIKECQKIGFQEINLNMGCPSATVVSKHKGSGMLDDLDYLKAFFDEVFKEIDPQVKLSVKIRIGIEDDHQAEALIQLLNQYPFYELIIHPRITKDYYKKPVRWDKFEQLLQLTQHDIVYNGNIFDYHDYQVFIQRFPQIKKIMLGRGIIANGALARELLGGETINKQEFLDFNKDLVEAYYEEMHDDRNVLFKMKELWYYQQTLFKEVKKPLKKVMKSKKIKEYEDNVLSLVQNCELNDDISKNIHFR